VNLLVTSINRPPAYSLAKALSPMFKEVHGTSPMSFKLLGRIGRVFKRIHHISRPSGRTQSHEDAKEVLDYATKLLHLCERLGVSHILPTQDIDIIATALHRDLFAKSRVVVVSPPADVIRPALDKAVVAKRALEVGFPTPSTEVISSVEHALHVAQSFEYPVVIKATPSMGSEGVRLVSDAETLKAVIPALQAAYDTVIMQEYIPGTKERSVNILLDADGKAICGFALKKFRYIHPSWSTSIEIFEPEELLEQTAKFLRSLGLRGFCAVQMKLDERDGSYKLIEVNPRFGANSRILLSRYPEMATQHFQAMTTNDSGNNIEMPDKFGVSFLDDILSFLVFLIAKTKKKKNELSASLPSLVDFAKSYIKTYSHRPFLDDYTKAFLKDPAFAIIFLICLVRYESNPPKHWRRFLSWGEV